MSSCEPIHLTRPYNRMDELFQKSHLISDIAPNIFTPENCIQYSLDTDSYAYEVVAALFQTNDKKLSHY